jgi:hypothetical protein
MTSKNISNSNKSLILSKAGGGKTTKVAQLAAKYTSEGKYVQVLSNEIDLEDFQWYAQKEKVNRKLVTYDYVRYMADTTNSIMNNTNAEVVFVDVSQVATLPKLKHATPSKELDLRLKLLKAIEDYTGKEIYVTTQESDNNNNNLLQEENLIYVIEYDQFIK